jgi:glycerol kinase
VWGSRDELRKTWQLDRRFEPGGRDDEAYERWRAAVELASTHPS